MAVSPGGPVTPDEVLDFLRKRHPKVLRAIEAEAVAAERERIKREVDGLPQMDVLAGPWPEASVVSAVLLPAVFRIIDGEATDG